MESKKHISMPVIKRLPRYYRYLSDLKRDGVERISSASLSKLMKITASQIRQDLNCFGGFGQQGYGYSVDMLLDQIGTILGVKSEFRTIIVGAGNMGQAIANYPSFVSRGFRIMGIFDNDIEKIGNEINGLKIMPITDMEKFIKKNNISVAMITTPRRAAKEVALRAVDAGVKALWNVSPMGLNLKGDIILENVHLNDGLMVLSYRLNELKEKENEY